MSKTTKDIEYSFSAKDTNVSSTVEKMGSSFDKLGDKVQKSAKKMSSTENSVKKVGNSMKQTSKDILYMESSLSSLATKLYNANAKNDKMAKSMKDVSKSNKNAVTSISNLKTELRNLSTNKDYDLEKTKKLKSETENLGKSLDKSRSRLDTVKNTITQLTNTKRVMLEQLIKARAEYGRDSEEVRTLNDEYKRFGFNLGQMQIMYKEESSALNRLSQQYQSHSSKLKAFENIATKENKRVEATKKQLALNEALYNKELALHNSISKTNRQLQAKASMASKTTNEMNNYRKRIQEISQQLAIETQKQDASTMSLMKFDSKLRMVNATCDTYEHKIKKLKLAKENLAQTIKEKEVAYKKLSSSMNSNGQEATRLKSDIEALKAQYNLLESELKGSEAEFEALKADAKALETQLASSKKQVTNFASSLRTIAKAGQEAGKGLSTAGKTVAQFGNMIQQAGRGLVGFGNSLRWITMTGTAVFGGAIKSGMDFEKAMADLASTIDVTELGVGGLSGAMDVLENKVRSLAKSTIFNPTEVAEGMKYLSLAGYSTSDMLATIEPLLKSAQISGQDLATATDLVTDAMASYRMEVKDMPKFLDAMAKVQASSNTNMAQATEAYIWAGGTLSDYNISLEESASLIGILANQGLKGAQAGRSLSSILVNLSKESGESYQALKKLHELSGKDVFAFNKDGSLKGTINQLKTIKEALDSLESDKDRNLIIQSIAGKTQMKTFTKLLAQINGEYDTLKSKIRNSNGELDRMHETVSQSSWAKFKEMLSAIQEALLQIWEVIQPLVMFLIQKITDLANKFSGLSEKQQLSILKFLAMATVVPILIKSLGFFILMLGSIVKAIGFFVIGAGKMVSAFFGIINIVLNLGSVFQKVGTFFTTAFAKIGSVIETVQIAFMYFVGFLKATVIPALTATAVTIGTLSIPVWAVIAVIMSLVGVLVWAVSAWKRGFDEMASPIENLGNMLKTMGEDIAHFFISIWNSVSGFIGRLTGKTKEEIEEMKVLSSKDKKAIEEGYSSHKDKKKQEKQAKKEAKKAEKVENAGNFLSNTGNFVKDSVGKLSEKITMNIDDGGFFGEFAGFMDGYEEFSKDFTGNKKTANFEAKIETDVLSVIEAQDELSKLENEHFDMEVKIAVSEEAVRYCDNQIQALIQEKQELEIDPVANKDRLAQIEKEMQKLTEKREANLEVIAKGDEKLKEIEEARNALEDKKITITTEYEELGRDEDFDQLLKQEEFYRKFNFELIHDNFDKDVEYVKERIEAIPDEIGELEKLIAVEADPEKKSALISELTALQEEQIVMELMLQYIESTEGLAKAEAEIQKLKEEYQTLEKEAKQIEWVSKQGIQLTEEQKNRLSEIKGRQEELTGEIKKQEEAQEGYNKALKEMGEGNINKVVEAMTTVREKQQEMANAMEEVSTSVEKVSSSTDSISFESATESANGLKESVEGIEETVSGLSDVFGTEYSLNVSTETAQAGLDGVRTTADNAKISVDNTKASLEALSGTSAGVNVEGLTSGLERARSIVDTIREKLISINNIANSTSVQAFSNMGKALVDKLTEARTAVLNIAGCARNSGVSAMTTMGQALTNALSGARQRVLDVANTARNYGASAMRAMGQALISQLNSARSIVSSIANTARSIRISIPTPGASGGGTGRSLLTAQYDDFVMPTSGVRAFAGISNSTNNTANNNSFSFNIDRVVMDSKADIKKTAKQFTIMCQREGILK